MSRYAWIRTAVIAATAAVTALAPSAATASPPIGLIAYSDVSRTQATDPVTVRVPAGSSAYVGRYTLAPGTGLGWREMPGVAIFSALSGTLRVVRHDCSLKDAHTGMSAVFPAGQYLIGNQGPDPVEFVAVFVNLRRGAAQPLSGPALRRAPADCIVSPRWTNPAVGGLFVTDLASGRFAERALRADGSGHLRQAGGGRIALEQGHDILVSTMTAAPGASSGWTSQYPALTFVNSGRLTYYEAVDDGCVKRAVFGPGDAYGRSDGGLNMVVNEGSVPATATSVYVNIPHRGVGLPIGNHLEAIDFTQLPPLECGRL